MSKELEARALWFAAPRTAELRPEIAPSPGPGDVRVRTLASAISGGTEMLVFRGEAPEGMLLDLPTLVGSYGFPIKYGYAAVGYVLDTGSHVQRLSPGDAVFVHHPHQDFFTVPAHTPVRLPEGFDPQLGVYCANLETALNIVHDTPLRLGETVLVFGQGVVGLLVTQLLKLSGAGAVLVVDPLEKRRELALAVGADVAFEPDDDIDAHLWEVTGGRGADVAVEVSGAGPALQTAIDGVAEEGTVVVASWYGSKPVSLSLGGHFHRGRVRLRSSQVGRLAPESGPRWDRDRRMAAVLKLLPRLRLEELVSHRIPFSRAGEAYRLLDERPGESVQIVLTYEEERGGQDV